MAPPGGYSLPTGYPKEFEFVQMLVPFAKRDRKNGKQIGVEHSIHLCPKGNFCDSIEEFKGEFSRGHS